MSTPSRCIRVTEPSAGTSTANSPTAEALRRRLQFGLPYGSADPIAQKSGTALRCVRAQIQGEDPLTVKVAVEALAALVPAAAIAALDELLEHAGLMVITRPTETPAPAGLLAANGALLAGIASVQNKLGAGLSDGILSPRESAQIAAALAETRVRIDVLLRQLGAVR